MAFARTFVFGFLFLAVALTKSAFANDITVTSVDRDRTLGPGDIVTIQIVEDRTPPVARSVTDTGELDVPVVGRIQVAGRTCAEVAAQVTKVLEADFYNKATVRLGIEKINRVKSGSATKVFVLGEVKSTGSQEILPGERLTIGGAVVKAGGGTQFANLRRVRLTRKSKDGSTQSFTVDVKAILEQGKMDKDIQLEDGDFVFVPRRFVTI